MNAFWFTGGKPSSRLIGWHHSPDSGTPVLGAVLLCAPWGVEHIRAYGAVRRLAISLARAGFHVLRFDYHATGDSSGASGEADPSLWPQDILAAARVLKQLSGSVPLSLVGLRLGGLLAAKAASLPQHDVLFEHLVLWDCPVSGKAYLKQMLALNDDLLSDLQAQGVAIPPEARVRELVGMPVSPLMIQAIEALDLYDISKTVNTRIQGNSYWFCSAPCESSTHLLAKLTEAGITPQLSLVPDDGHWFDARRHAFALQAYALPQAICQRLMETATPQGSWQTPMMVGSLPSIETPHDEPREEVLRFGSQQRLVGIVTLPPAKSSQQDCPDIILLNPGLLYRIGAYRTSVALARALARMGFRVLRMDISGIGDSEPRRDRTVQDSNPAVQDVIEAIDYLAQSYGTQQFVLQGLCNGAGLAHSVALKDPRVMGLLGIDSYAYRTPHALMRLITNRLTHPAALANLLSIYAQKAFSKTYWMKKFGQQPNFDEGALGEMFQFPPRQQLQQEMLTLAERGVSALYIFTKGADVIFNHPSQFWQMFPALKAHPSFEVLLNRDSDHTSMFSSSRRKLINQMTNWMVRHFGHGSFVPLVTPKMHTNRASDHLLQTDLTETCAAPTAFNGAASLGDNPASQEDYKSSPYSPTPNG